MVVPISAQSKISMNNIFRSLMVLGSILSIVGCQSANLAAPNTKPIVLKSAQVRTNKFKNVVEFPAGTYEPDFQTKKGVYYRAPGHLVSHGMGMNIIIRGGLFIPFNSEKDQRQGSWADQQEGSGGIIGFGLTSNTRIFRFKPPVDYENKEK